ncbi:hypothetical protein A9Q96_10270 [Rhodobacterales bacterium 52_120_T64]|nr:hypothetical protein A9Q96_10270 [Rhodobacterales bacterium 52_120_T64]
MSNTYQFGLPLLQAAQAQKHVTVNEALARLDAVVQMRVKADDWEIPSANSVEGEAHVVGPIASNEWAGQSGKVAIVSNGGWVFLTPKIGWRAWNEVLGAEIVYDGVNWVRFAGVIAAGGAASLQRVVEIDHTLSAGVVSVTSNVIPSHAQVIGVTARVISTFTGAGVSSWSLGVAGAADRYGSGLGLALNSVAKGATGPLTYWADTALEVTADSGSFDGGIVRLAVHLVELEVPRAV